MKAVCKICDREFVKAKYNQAYCSDECKRLAENRRRRNERKAVRANRVFKCLVCASEFTPKHGLENCCSEECKKKRKNDCNRKHRKKQYAKTKQTHRLKQGVTSRSSRNVGTKIFERAQQRRWKLMQEVIDAQRGPIEELYEKSKKWTKEQRDFAKARYMKIHFGK